MSRELWTDAYLDQMRTIGDPEADAIVHRVFERRQFSALNAFVGSLSGSSDLPRDLPPEIRDFVERTSARPTWVQDMHLRRSERFFTRHGLASMMALVCASLPECYTMRRGVRILALTRQLGAHIDRRLHQTALMVIAVMRPHGLDLGGPGVEQAQRVRLIHAAIRHLILLGKSSEDSATGLPLAGAEKAASPSIAAAMNKAGFKWSITDDGQPLNQEDLAFTLLTFSYILPLAMSRFGIPVTDDDHVDFLHTWNVVGAYLGIRRELMPETKADAAYLLEQIKRRQWGASEDGAFLTDRLIGFLQENVLRLHPLAPLAPVFVRAMVGDDTARVLGMNTRHHAGVILFHQVVARLVRALNVIGAMLGRFHPLRRLSTIVGERTIQVLYNYSSQHGDAPLAIPVEWSGVKGPATSLH
jgi:ER-bound oxygenase mpaB/B'/Rubber oxygenase, catalytic domain